MQGAATARARDLLIERVGGAETVGEVFRIASERLRRVVPFDASVWMSTDPATGLPTAPSRAENLGHVGGANACARAWELEFFVSDVNLFGDLAQAGAPAAALRLATGGDPGQSTRYRALLGPHGFADELRAVLVADGSPWGLVTLLRAEGTAPFASDEIGLLAGLSRPLAEAVREHARSAPGAGGDARGPGLLVFDRDGELVSVNDDAPAWLEELAWLDGEHAFGLPLPTFAIGALMRARDRGSARARLRSPAMGRWIVCHASCLRDADGRVGETVLVIEAAKASEIAPIIVQAYELSRREQQITQLIARGLGTGQIAERLHLSTHTVRDYVKATFDKVGVSSRGELVAKLFAEHYAPPGH